MGTSRCIERLSCFRKKSVINIADGSCLGNVCDIEFDVLTGCIFKIIVSKKGCVCSFLCDTPTFMIPFNKIVRTGEDIILVDVCAENVKEGC